MPLPVYQNMVNLIVGVPIWRCPSIFMSVAIGNIVLMTMRFLDVAKFTTLNSIIITKFAVNFHSELFDKNYLIIIV
jgi:hypothetical protein